MSEHTPGPWTLKPNGACYNLKSPDRVNHFCILVGMNAQPEGEHAANADFIARACNAHEELLEACKMAIGFCVNARQTWTDWQKYPEIGRLFAILTTAIAKAETK